MPGLPSYEYLVSRIRARASGLFDRSSYRAILGSSSPLEAAFLLKQSRFRERIVQLTATDYEGIKKWLATDFPETFDFVEENAPVSVRAFLGKVRDVFTAVYVSRLLAAARGVGSPLSQALSIPSTRQLQAAGPSVRSEALLQAFLDEQLRAQAKYLISSAAQAGKAFPLFGLPAFAARNALAFAESLGKPEFGGLRPLMEAVSAGSMMVVSVSSRAEGGNTSLLDEGLRSTLGDSPPPAEEVASLPEAERLCWHATASRARNCLIGYPFRARTLVGFLFLEWFDVANWRLALLAAQDVLTTNEADAAFIIA